MASVSNDFHKRMEAICSLARYTDQQYLALSQYMKSSDFQTKVDKACKAGESAAKLKTNRTSLTEDQCKAQRIFSKQSLVDNTEIQNTRKAEENYLYLAMK